MSEKPLEVSPNGGWNDNKVVDAEVAKWERFCEVSGSSGPLGFSHEQDRIHSVRNLYHHNVNMAFGYALALAACKTNPVAVMDWGGGLGHYYKIAKALLPDTKLEYHVKEVPSIARCGKQMNPEVIWHDDDSCLDAQYDLVFVNASLPYIDDWKGLLQRLCACTRGYFLLTRIPVVLKANTYLAIQRAYGTTMIHRQFNQGVLLEHMASAGLELLREILVGGSPYIRGAPEQPEMRGWLFKRPPNGVAGQVLTVLANPGFKSKRVP